eukprot:TRINITY_DN1031_c2_g1_i2.p1 TRINITY_DN1031_c2_g1~~TRINITY_DN1031_c2_g1_i2.p1  ORF type:complete len:356 (-),score=74.15 TRINITY_DN1031_c2_g1_i2:5-1072(-)
MSSAVFHTDSPNSMSSIMSGSDDNSASSPPNSFAGLEAPDMRLLHKPRGSQGAWQSVAAGSRLRVPKDRGKRLKLEISAPHRFVCGAADVCMVDLDRPDQPVEPGSFVILSAIATSHLVIDLKVFKMAKRVQFNVTLRTGDGEAMTMSSITFTTHNSGVPGGERARAKLLKSMKPEEPASDDEDDPPPKDTSKRRQVPPAPGDLQWKRIKNEVGVGVSSSSSPSGSSPPNLSTLPDALLLLPPLPVLSPVSEPDFDPGFAENEFETSFATANSMADPIDFGSEAAFNAFASCEYPCSPFVCSDTLHFSLPSRRLLGAAHRECAHKYVALSGLLVHQLLHDWQSRTFSRDAGLARR